MRGPFERIVKMYHSLEAMTIILFVSPTEDANVDWNCIFCLVAME